MVEGGEGKFLAIYHNYIVLSVCCLHVINQDVARFIVNFTCVDFYSLTLSDLDCIEMALQNS